MGEQMTVEQVVEITINMLSEIKVPAGLISEIGIPVSNAISNLKQCMAAWEEQRKEEWQTAADEAEPEE